MNDQTSSNQENTDHDNMNVADVDLDINEISFLQMKMNIVQMLPLMNRPNQ